MEFPHLGQHCSEATCNRLGKIECHTPTRKQKLIELSSIHVQIFCPLSATRATRSSAPLTTATTATAVQEPTRRTFRCPSAHCVGSPCPRHPEWSPMSLLASTLTSSANRRARRSTPIAAMPRAASERSSSRWPARSVAWTFACVIDTPATTTASQCLHLRQRPAVGDFSPYSRPPRTHDPWLPRRPREGRTEGPRAIASAIPIPDLDLCRPHKYKTYRAIWWVGKLVSTNHLDRFRLYQTLWLHDWNTGHESSRPF